MLRRADSPSGPAPAPPVRLEGAEGNGAAPNRGA